MAELERNGGRTIAHHIYTGARLRLVTIGVYPS